MEIPDPLFREAVAAMDAGDVDALERLLEEHPRLAVDRLETGDGYFHRPYLLWFVAGNPVRNDRLPANTPEVARAILRAIERRGTDTLREQVDYALALVCSGRVPRESRVQRALVDILLDAGADPDGALPPALAHREAAAAERLLERGARLTLPAAACTGSVDDVARLAPAADPDERRAALAMAALHGRADVLAVLLAHGAEPDAYPPPGYHPHATALHHAVDSGSLDAVRVLVEAGADPGLRDRVYEGTPLGWAEHLRRPEITAYLRERGAP